jgi:hypothetical protein
MGILESTMTLHATIHEHVAYRPGDGPLIEIPPGPVEVDLSVDSATLSWTETNGEHGLAAIPLADYKDYVRKKQITPA